MKHKHQITAATKRHQLLQRTIRKKNNTQRPKMITLPPPVYTDADKQIKIAIIQTGSWGDNINSTLMLKPLKQKFPDSIIDVHTSTTYASAFKNNPYINNLIQYQANDKNEALHLTLTIPPMLMGHNYNITYAPHPMFNPENWTSINHPEIGDNLICAWIRALEHTDVPYTMPLETILQLTDEEVNRVQEYCQHVPDMQNRRAILMEISGESGQTFWSPSWTIEVSKYLLNGSTNLFISRKNDSNDVQELRALAPGCVHFVGQLSIRECAELFNRCHAFFSVSSGLSNACGTNWCKKDIKWFEVVNSPAVTSAPIRKEVKTFWYINDCDKFIEILKSKGV